MVIRELRTRHRSQHPYRATAITAWTMLAQDRSWTPDLFPVTPFRRSKHLASDATLYWMMVTAWYNPGVIVPAAKGEPSTGVSAPVIVLIVNADTSLDPVFATYANCPVRSMVTTKGLMPTANGAPATGVSIPVVALIVNADTSFDPAFATYANCPEGSMTNWKGFVPAAKGEPTTEVSPGRCIDRKRRHVVRSAIRHIGKLPGGTMLTA